MLAYEDARKCSGSGSEGGSISGIPKTTSHLDRLKGCSVTRKSGALAGGDRNSSATTPALTSATTGIIPRGGWPTVMRPCQGNWLCTDCPKATLEGKP